MKNTLIILIAIFISFAAKSQQYIYSYDNAGNRISRMAIILSSAAQNPPDSSDNQTANYEGEAVAKQAQYESVLNGQVITVYPNPTNGELKIDISNFEEGSKGSILVTDMQGRIILRQESINAYNLINLSSASAGQYVMKLVINGKANEWVIIKE